MLSKNSFLTGVLAGLILPAFGCLAAFLLKHDVDIINRPGLPYLIATALNLIVMRICLKKDLDHTAKGIMLTSFVFFVAIFLLVIHPIR